MVCHSDDVAISGLVRGRDRIFCKPAMIEGLKEGKESAGSAFKSSRPVETCWDLEHCSDAMSIRRNKDVVARSSNATVKLLGLCSRLLI